MNFLHPVDPLERAERVAPKPDRHRPRAGDDEIQLRVVCPDFRSVRHTVPRLRAHVVAREELPVPVVDRLPRLPIEDLDDVVNVLARMRWRVVRTDAVRVAVRHLTQRIGPVIAARRRARRQNAAANTNLARRMIASRYCW